MAINIRPTYITEERPTLIWDLIENIRPFTFKVFKKKCPDSQEWEKVWKKELSMSDYSIDKKDNYIEFEYPKEFAPLEETVTYLITGETETKEGLVSAKGEFILLESKVREEFKTLQNQINKTNSEDLNKPFYNFFNLLFMVPSRSMIGGENTLPNSATTGAAGWRKFNLPCFTMKFSPTEVSDETISG